MSRCFPFPPPGYQSQLRSDQVDSLEKEKHKEKHKKAKKDKEKRDSKERKDRERSRDKHKDKKDRKEKHKDKDKKKDKDAHKDSSGTFEETKNEERFESLYEVRIGESSKRAEEIKDSKFAELGRRTRDEEKGATNSMLGSLQKVEGMGAATAMGTRRTTGAEMVGILQGRFDEVDQPMGNSAGSVERIEHTGGPTAKNKYSINHMVANLVSSQKVENLAMGCAADNLVGSMHEMQGGMHASSLEKERSANKVFNAAGMEVPSSINKEQKKNHRISGPQLNVVSKQQPIALSKRDGRICTSNSMEKRSKEQSVVPQSICTAPGWNKLCRPLENVISSCQTATEKEKSKADHMVANHVSSDYTNNVLSGLAQKDVFNNMEAKEKTRHTEIHDCNGDRHDTRDGNEKKRKREDKDRHQEKEKEKEKGKEKMKEKGEGKHKKEKYKLKKSGKKDPVVISNTNPPLHKEYANGGADEKKMDLKVNGFLHETDERPSKLQKTSFSPPSLENGRTLMPCHTAQPSVLNGATESVTAIGVAGKEHKTNGVARPQPVNKSVMAIGVAGKEHKTNGVARPQPVNKSVMAIGVAGKEHKTNGVARPQPVNKSVMAIGVADKEQKTSGITKPQPATKSVMAIGVDDKEQKSSGITRPQPATKSVMAIGVANKEQKASGTTSPQPATESVMAIGVADNEQKTSGITRPQPLSVDVKPSPAADTIKKVRLKPPHPDSKYLNQIYTVPKMEELPDFDEQDWLFSGNHLPKLNTKFNVEETPHVWAEAMQIDAADVIALPYVIPY